MSPLLKNLLIGLGIAVIALIGAYLYQQRPSEVVTTVNERVANQAALETQDFLRRLQELRDVELSDTIFTDERFESLVDWHVETRDEPIGKTNPFAPTE